MNSVVDVLIPQLNRSRIDFDLPAYAPMRAREAHRAVAAAQSMQPVAHEGLQTASLRGFDQQLRAMGAGKARKRHWHRVIYANAARRPVGLLAERARLLQERKGGSERG